MKYKTLFRLMLKAVGVWLFFTGGAQLILYVGYMVRTDIWRGTSSSIGWQLFIQFTGPIVQIGAALYLFFGGKWIADKAIPSNRPYCHECGYDLTGATGDVCNECGTPFRGPGCLEAVNAHE